MILLINVISFTVAYVFHSGLEILFIHCHLIHVSLFLTFHFFFVQNCAGKEGRKEKISLEVSCEVRIVNGFLMKCRLWSVSEGKRKA